MFRNLYIHVYKKNRWKRELTFFTVARIMFSCWVVVHWYVGDVGTWVFLFVLFSFPMIELEVVTLHM